MLVSAATLYTDIKIHNCIVGVDNIIMTPMQKQQVRHFQSGRNLSNQSNIHITLPARSCFSVSHTLQLKSSYPPINNRPLLENATDVMPQIILSCEYMPISWSERMSNSRQVASSEPVAKANPLGKN